MSNDKTTLADVQPGGRVRLGDQALSTSEGARRYVADFFATQLRRQDFGDYILTELAADFACALAQHLSAQPSPGETLPPDMRLGSADYLDYLDSKPSPGGQDALLESLVARWRKDADEVGISDNLLCQKIANCTMRHAAELQAVLAARQPVEQVIEYQTYRGYGGGSWDKCDKEHYDNGKAFEAKFGDGGKSLYRTLVVGDAAPPAQAVDLGPLTDLVNEWSHLADQMQAVLPQGSHTLRGYADQLKGRIALIDSQAVGK